jgi:CheY-like chemotaxis protein
MEPEPREARGTQAILIVDSDESIGPIGSILDLSLRHAGFSVGLAGNREEAIKRLANKPDLVIVAASDPDGLAFCRLVKQTGDPMPAAVVLIADPGIENKTRGLEAGADDFVIKPIYVQEVVARARALLQRRERERLELSASAQAAVPIDGAEGAPPAADRFVSDIADVPLVDLLRAIPAHQRSGVASITAAGGARGEIFFRQGNVVDAEVGRLSGRDAVYRLFCWSAGRLEIEWKSIRRKDTIEMRPDDLLMEALRRVDEWRRLLAGLPPLDTIFEVDYRVLAERLADIPDEVNRILRLFDGVRTFLQVIDDCGLSDLDAAAAIGKLCQERIVHDVRVPVADEDVLGADLEGWLSEATGPFRSPPRLERDLFGASPEAGIGVHGRPTSPLESLGEAAQGPLDEDMRARFTDRLEAEGQPPEPVPEPPPVVPTARPSVGYPNTLQGLGAQAPEAPRAAVEPPVPAVEPPVPAAELPAPAAEPPTSAGEMASSIEAATSVQSAPSTPNAPKIAEEDATPIIEPPVTADVVSPEPTRAPPVAAALPAATEARSASGEIVVRPANAKIKQSPAAQARLAHLREENARAYVRPSQSLTPPGSARALDEPPPLVEGPAPEPPARPTALAVSADPDQALSAAEASEELEPTTHRRGLLLVAAVAVLVLGAGALVLRSRGNGTGESSGEESTAEETAAHPPAAPRAPSVAPTIVPIPVASAAGVEAGAGPSPGATAARTLETASATHDELDERAADPKMARARAAEAASLLSACHLSFQEQRMKDAEAACTAARDANMDSAEAHGFLAHALFNRNHRRESLVEAERAVKLNPQWADAYVIIGGVHQDAGEMDDARRAYQRYLDLDPRGQYANDLRTIVDRLGKL